MKHKVADLEGALLDAAVAKGEGFVRSRHPGGFDLWCRADDPNFSHAVEPGYFLGDTSFRTIIERERIDLAPQNGGSWSAQHMGGQWRRSGETPLVAAMRCFVASKLGDEVELP